jgi:poly [ADP-ribose] polymerase
MVQLVCVTSDNHNKFYHMTDNQDGTFTSHWGRVGAKGSKKIYPMSQWDKIFKAKTKKGYRDISSLKVDNGTAAQIPDQVIRQLVDSLVSMAKQVVAQQYVNGETTTQAQIDEAQKIISSIKQAIRRKSSVDVYNRLLIELYTAIPRKMKKVQDHLITHWSQIQDLLQNEQDLLDILQGQIGVQTQSGQTILEAMGLEIQEASDTDVTLIKKLMASESRGKFKRAFVVINKKTQERFDEHIAQAQSTRTRLYWHGSRNENWWSILGGGLMMNPSKVVRTGDMFGRGIYFASRCKKSMGYTSLSGSYWAKGTSTSAYMALFDVHIGRQMRIKKHSSMCYGLDSQTLQAQGYDSVFAEKGADLINDEFIVYKEEQCTVKYLVEIG